VIAPSFPPPHVRARNARRVRVDRCGVQQPFASSICSADVLSWSYNPDGSRKDFGLVTVPGELLTLGRASQLHADQYGSGRTGVPGDDESIKLDIDHFVKSSEKEAMTFQGEQRMLIDGELMFADSGKEFDIINPATEEVLGTVAEQYLETKAVAWPRTFTTDFVMSEQG